MARGCLAILEEAVQQAQADGEEEKRERVSNFTRLWGRVRGQRHNPVRPWDPFLGQSRKLLFNGGYNIWRLWEDETAEHLRLLGVSFWEGFRHQKETQHQTNY
jgi:hypothetical protein